MSARSSRPGSSSKEATLPPKRSASARARSARRLATRKVATPRSCSARATSSLVSPAPMITTLRDRSSPSASSASATATEATRRAARADRRLGPHPLAGLQRGGEEAVRQRPGGARRERVLVGALDLALHLGLAQDHRLQPGGDAEEVTRGVAVARRVHDLGELGGAKVALLREQPDDRRLGGDRLVDDDGDLHAVARGDRPPPPARWGGSAARWSTSGIRASVSDSRSRSSTGAVLYETPMVMSSLTPRRSGSRVAAACVARVAARG